MLSANLKMQASLVVLALDGKESTCISGFDT